MMTGRPRTRVFDEELAVKRYKELGNSKKVADELGTGPDVVIRVLKKMGVDIPKSGARRVLSAEQEDEVVKLYNSGSSQSKIAKMFGLSQQGIGIILSREGVIIRATKAWETVDEHFFDKVDSEEKAYWLYFLAADGYVIDRGSVIGVSLKAEDRMHLGKFAKSIGYSGRILWRREKRKDLPRRDECQLSFKSVIMKKKLEEWGIVQSKSKSLVLRELPVELRRHGMRGLIDADGCLFSDVDGKMSISLCGSKMVCGMFRDFLVDGGIGTKAEVMEGDGCHVFSVSSSETKRIVELLYKDANVFLDRKMAIAKEWLGLEGGFEIRGISRDVAGEFVAKYHYLGGISSWSVCYGLFRLGELVGVATIGSSTNPTVADSIVGKENRKRLFELTRFVVKPGQQKNTSSFFISRLLKKVKEDFKELWVLVAFADPAQDHVGTIYQAANAIYYGQSEKELVIVTPDGKKVSGRYAVDRIGEADLKDCRLEKTEGKHKYVFLLNAGKDVLRVNGLPYPKKLI
jgi:hypothetical protein